MKKTLAFVILLMSISKIALGQQYSAEEYEVLSNYMKEIKEARQRNSSRQKAQNNTFIGCEGKVLDKSMLYMNWVLYENDLVNFQNENISVNTGYNNSFTSGIISNASISDENGQLLFYIDGLRVYDNNHNIITEDIGGSSFSSQGVTCIPVPNCKNAYFVITITDCLFGDGDIDNFGDKYLTVTKLMRNTQGNFVVDTSYGTGGQVRRGARNGGFSYGERVGIVMHANSEDYWVVVRNQANNDYHSYLITQNGIADAPIISAGVGDYITITSTSGVGTESRDMIGTIKFSPNSQWMISVFGINYTSSSSPNSKVRLYPFDNETGRLGIGGDVASRGRYYGASFSPNSEYIYFTDVENGVFWNNVNSLSNPSFSLNLRSDLSNNNSGNSYVSHNFYDLQLGVNNRIYGSNKNHVMYEISDPDNPTTTSFDYEDGVGFRGLPNFAVQGFDCNQHEDLKLSITAYDVFKGCKQMHEFEIEGVRDDYEFNESCSWNIVKNTAPSGPESSEGENGPPPTRCDLRVEYLQEGDYTVTVTFQIYNSLGCMEEQTITEQLHVEFSEPPIVNTVSSLVTGEMPCSKTYEFSYAIPSGYILSNRPYSEAWNYGDGSTSSIVSATSSHTYNRQDQFLITAKADLVESKTGCPYTITPSTTINVKFSDDELFENKLISLSTPVDEDVLQASASEYTDFWPMLQGDISQFEKNAWLTGQQGVWRHQSSWAYQEDREQDSPYLKSSEDGVFNFERFQWNHTMPEINPHWKKASTTTRYNGEGYMIENQDILGIHSSSVYGYYGQLPVAVAQNAKQDEIAFTSFEESNQYNSTFGINTGYSAEGNFDIDLDGKFRIRGYKVPIGKSLDAMVKSEVSDLDDPDMRYFLVGRKFENYYKRRFSYFWGWTDLGCVREVDSWNDAIYVNFDNNFTANDYWFGWLFTLKAISGNPTANISTTYSHTGDKSLLINANTTLNFKQYTLDLQKNGEYLFSAWVATSPEAAQTSASLGNGISIEVKFIGDENQSFVFEPSGPIVEGWQKVEGYITVPDQYKRFELIFSSGAKNLYVDDMRMQPKASAMLTYVYDPRTYRLQAVLDDNNFATFYYYDAEGMLYLTKVETVRGLKTLQESINFIPTTE
ncbi:hypothetical protein [Aureibacter tunicatorum]|uniref:PKD domain-containing protein n=1 Tax=Aureibacter tunicatorum TaxID=866807 RepID=A0AAE4BT67_9BACT|nr:hypothetical protein [Aureibacter tunicatorum]MDR6240476.1 hypothetical protein [Aureibacter tunicatorum]BDD05645.1 hypothetical protein AUTU_31280 [Aureibacter tunicatorum]